MCLDLEVYSSAIGKRGYNFSCCTAWCFISKLSRVFAVSTSINNVSKIRVYYSRDLMLLPKCYLYIPAYTYMPPILQVQLRAWAKFLSIWQHSRHTELTFLSRYRSLFQFTSLLSLSLSLPLCLPSSSPVQRRLIFTAESKSWQLFLAAWQPRKFLIIFKSFLINIPSAGLGGRVQLPFCSCSNSRANRKAERNGMERKDGIQVRGRW